MARAIKFGERRTEVRSLAYGVFKHTATLVRWQLKWTCSLLTEVESMIEEGSAPWMMATKIYNCSALWNPKRWYSWPSIEAINRMTYGDPNGCGKGIPAGDAKLAMIIREHIVGKIENRFHLHPTLHQELHLLRFKGLGPSGGHEQFSHCHRGRGAVR